MSKNGRNKDTGNKILLFKLCNNSSASRKRRLLRLQKATNIINLSFERILEAKIKQLEN